VVYVTIPGERLVLRVDASGARRIVARSPVLWAAHGVMVDRAGNLWLLETSSVNAVRVRRIDKNGKERVY
jgi:hypothetical protein